MAVEMSADKIGDAVAIDRMQVLELVGCGELLDVQAIGEHTVGLSLEEVLALIGSDVADSGEDIGAMGGTALYAVAMVDATFSSLSIYIKVL